ncbi:MAG: polysaccharide deacetylase family protein, partial [Desulfobacterales bacterium]
FLPGCRQQEQAIRLQQRLIKNRDALKTLDRYWNGFKRRARQNHCRWKYLRSPKAPALMNMMHLTVFFDYEGKYSRPDQEKNSAKGLEYILDTLERAGITATFNCVGRLIDDQRDTLEQIKRSGHEIASHTVAHTPVGNWTQRRMADDIEEFQRLLQPIANPVAGFRPPQSKWRFQTLKGLLKSGIIWDAADDPAPFPYVILQKGGRRLWRMPTGIDDWNFEKNNTAPAVMLDSWCATVRSAIQKRKYVAVGFHPWVLGKDNARLAAFSGFVDWLSKLDNVVIAPFGEIARRCESEVMGQKSS